MTASPQFPIVGVGASAGGVQALAGLFKGVESSCGLAFVIVTHLNPERESQLHDVISRFTEMPVLIAEHDRRIEVNHVYVMPQNAILSVEAGVLKIERPNLVHRQRKPIDVFFSSLAEDHGGLAVGIVLSGGDGDGTLGAKAIKEAGGLTLAQTGFDGAGPKNPDMPESAISAGMIDISLPAEEMGSRLHAFARSFGVRDSVTRENLTREDSPIEKARVEICAILSGHTGHDFWGYKAKTFIRRVRRRMQVHQTNAIDDYVRVLKTDAVEVINLFRDLLINVTNFFRDADAFELLARKVVPTLFEGKGAGDTVRIWVPGCATGEEVYSLAILMLEYIDGAAVSPKVQIFATDIDEPALVVARSARYPESLLEGVSKERRERFFRPDGGSYVLNTNVRELCIFSPHSLIKDPPFSKMDLVSCRNLLIYFGPDIQKQVIPTFHYSLKPGGFLFLGSSESIGAHGDLFAPVDKKLRIFQTREHPAQMPRLPSLNNYDRSASFPENKAGGTRNITNALKQAAESRVLDRYAPAHVVVTGDGDVVYYSTGTGRFLEAPQGAPSRQLMTIARRGLRLDLRSALREAAETRRVAIRNGLTVERDDDLIQPVSISVEPLGERSGPEPFYLVLFNPFGSPQEAGDVSAGRKVEPRIEFETELQETRERLQSTIEEYETALEELKSSNEELVSVNEEVQSSNEELEASKEETQSLNEELNTINTELHMKIEEIDRANADLRNLFESTQIATIFLDANLVIRTFTPAAASFFNLRNSDIGRPLTELASQLEYPELKSDIDGVLATGAALDHHLARDSSGKHFLVRLIPYLKNARTDGVVVTLVDVTKIAEAEQHQKVLVAELNHRVKNMLAIATAIANRTVEYSPSPAEFSVSFKGRLDAMARAYGALSANSWKEASLHDLVKKELEAFGTDSFNIEGNDIPLNAEFALPVGMVLHELATNAAKHGALSQFDGQIAISVESASDEVTIVWQESGGPTVREPNHKGFGLELLRGEIGYRLRGQLRADFAPGGLRVEINFPLGR